MDRANYREECTQECVRGLHRTNPLRAMSHCIVFVVCLIIALSLIFTDHLIIGLSVSIGLFVIFVVLYFVFSTMRKIRVRKSVTNLVHTEEMEEFGSFPDGGRARRSLWSKTLLANDYPECTNLGQVFEIVAEKNADRRCLAEREVRGVEKVTDNGKIPYRYDLGEYKYQTFRETLAMAKTLSSALNHILGSESDKKLGILAASQVYYHLLIEACFRAGVTLTTFYSNLGNDAIIYAMNNSEITTLVCDVDYLEKLQVMLPSAPHIRTVIVLDRFKGKHPMGNVVQALQRCPLGDTVKAYSFDDLMNLGNSNLRTDLDNKGKLDDVVLLMYTSGSSGVPKGVTITNQNILSSMAGMHLGITTLCKVDSEIFLSFLPLAHIFAFQCDICIIYGGGCVAYSSPLTIVKGFPGLTAGCDGDFTSAKPTCMAVVPLLLDRIRKTVLAKVAGSPVKKALFNLAYSWKRSNEKGHHDTSFWDWMLFDAIRTTIFGGRLRMFICAGSYVLPEVQEFCRLVFKCSIFVGYGLTETICGGTLTLPHLKDIGSVGVPNPCCSIRLKDWPEGGYTSADKPFPRGEILIHGMNVIPGYYLNPEETAAALQKDAAGRQWFCTGDIGLWDKNGCLQIIDRKKDLIKMQQGEYLSLSKVESALLESTYVENICIYAKLSATFCTAIVCVKEQYTGISEATVLEDLQRVGVAAHLSSFEIPKYIVISDKIWTPESDLVTPSFKVKRKVIYEAFSERLASLAT